MPLPQKKLIPGILLMLVIAALAAPPLWWSAGDPPVIDANATENNSGPANIGQAMHMAKSALDALEDVLPSVATQIEQDLTLPQPNPAGGTFPAILDFTVPDPKDDDWILEQKSPLLIGQLKAIADPFYNRLQAVAPVWLEAERTSNNTNHLNSIFPWTAEVTDDENKAVANIGQLKAVFCLRFETLVTTGSTDSDGDGIPDDWESNYGLNPNDPADAAGDLIGDGVSNLVKYKIGRNPTVPALPDTSGITGLKVHTPLEETL